MSTQTLSSRDFNQHPGIAKKSAAKGPVIITDRGKPTHVLLSYQEYRKLVGQRSLLDALAMEADIEFEPPRHEGRFHVPVDFETDVSD